MSAAKCLSCNCTDGRRSSGNVQSNKIDGKPSDQASPSGGEVSAAQHNWEGSVLDADPVQVACNKHPQRSHAPDS